MRIAGDRIVAGPADDVLHMLERVDLHQLPDTGQLDMAVLDILRALAVGGCLGSHAFAIHVGVVQLLAHVETFPVGGHGNGILSTQGGIADRVGARAAVIMDARSIGKHDVIAISADHIQFDAVLEHAIGVDQLRHHLGQIDGGVGRAVPDAPAVLLAHDLDECGEFALARFRAPALLFSWRGQRRDERQRRPLALAAGDIDAAGGDVEDHRLAGHPLALDEAVHEHVDGFQVVRVAGNGGQFERRLGDLCRLHPDHAAGVPTGLQVGQHFP
ncbi:Uncharacterised protein [Bordetella pertussis]|nr:Uncharacterised protein [Bordetella pertussis]